MRAVLGINATQSRMICAMESMLASRDVPGIKLNASVRMEPSPSQPCRGSCEICQACTVQMAEMGHGIASACSVLVSREDRHHLGPSRTIRKIFMWYVGTTSMAKKTDSYRWFCRLPAQRPLRSKEVSFESNCFCQPWQIRPY